jgi:hypothetical protein
MADFQQRESFARSTPTKFDGALQRYLFALDRLLSTDDKSDENSDMLTDAMTQAENGLMAEPAADLHQLRIKADILWSDVDSLPPAEHILAFFCDLVRLTGGGASRVFDPARWLARFEHHGGGWVVQDGRTVLMWPDLDRVRGLTQELEMRGGKQAVLDLIRARHEGEGA